MPDLNKVFLIGRLTQDPDLRYTPNGFAVADLRLATSRTWTGKDGERKEDKLFIDVTVWNKVAENCCQYLRKGRLVHVEGALKSDSWESPTGEKRTKIKVEADRVQFLERRDDSPGGAGSGAGGGAEAESDHDDFPAASGPREPRRSTYSEGPSSGGPPAPNSRGAGSAMSRPPQSPPVEPAGAEEDIPF